MATAINVLKQNISELLSSGKNSKFVIPEYQDRMIGLMKK